MERRKRLVLTLSVLFGIILLSSACHKKKVAAAPPAPPPAPAPAPPAAPTASLTAEPATIEKGQSATLSWNTSDATDIDIEPNVGKQQASGSTTVTPDDSTTYVLTATGPGGNTTASARVTVTQPPPPPPPPAPTVSESELVDTNMKDAYFDFDKSDIRPDAQTTLTADGDFLKAHPDIHVTLEGDCDDRGSEEYNLGLGDRRATSAKSFLVNLGVPADQMYTISFGKDRPQCTDATEECWQKNRRVHFHFGQETR